MGCRSLRVISLRHAPHRRAPDGEEYKLARMLTGPVVDVTAVVAARDDARLLPLDCRFDLARPAWGGEEYTRAHLPGAARLDLDADLAGHVVPGRTGRHPLPDADALAARLRALGGNDDSVFVCYDQGPGAFAARAWWLLRWLGHAGACVLDGGLAAWLAAGHPVTAAVPNRAPGNLQRRPALVQAVSAGELAGCDVLLDAREAARFRGEVEPIDPVAGHIPGARSAPWVDNLAGGHLLPPAALRQRYAALVGAGRRVACYCGSGVTACHDILAMVHAGLPEPALYAGSFSEWITDPARPVARGP
jgi:thiosulfate/3-mercaptopyruvate sulfurtransferase